MRLSFLAAVVWLFLSAAFASPGSVVYSTAAAGNPVDTAARRNTMTTNNSVCALGDSMTRGDDVISSDTFTASGGIGPYIFQVASPYNWSNFQGYISGTILVVTSVSNGAIMPGASIPAAAPGTFITGHGTGDGNTGTYTINNSQTVGSRDLPTALTTSGLPPWLRNIGTTTLVIRPQAAMSMPNAATIASSQELQPGHYDFKFLVSDSAGNSGFETVIATVLQDSISYTLTGWTEVTGAGLSLRHTNRLQAIWQSGPDYALPTFTLGAATLSNKAGGTNFGARGDTTGGMLKQLGITGVAGIYAPHSPLAAGCAAYTVMGGTNNLNPRLAETFAQTQSDLTGIYEGIRATDAAVIALPIAPRHSRSPANTRFWMGINQFIASICAQGNGVYCADTSNYGDPESVDWSPRTTRAFITTSNGKRVSYTVSTLPAGVTMTPDGVFASRATMPSKATITVTATGSGSSFGTQQFLLSVNPALDQPISLSYLPGTATGTILMDHSFTLSADGLHVAGASGMYLVFEPAAEMLRKLFGPPRWHISSAASLLTFDPMMASNGGAIEDGGATVHGTVPSGDTLRVVPSRGNVSDMTVTASHGHMLDGTTAERLDISGIATGAGTPNDATLIELQIPLRYDTTFTSSTQIRGECRFELMPGSAGLSLPALHLELDGAGGISAISEQGYPILGTGTDAPSAFIGQDAAAGVLRGVLTTPYPDITPLTNSTLSSSYLGLRIYVSANAGAPHPVSMTLEITGCGAWET